MVFGLDEGDVGDAGIGAGLVGDGLDGVVVFLEVGGVEGADDEAELGAFGGAVGRPEYGLEPVLLGLIGGDGFGVLEAVAIAGADGGVGEVVGLSVGRDEEEFGVQIGVGRVDG